MDILTDIRPLIKLILPLLAGVAIGGGTFTYLMSLPSVVLISTYNVSQAYSLLVFGIMFFSANVGTVISLFAKAVFEGRLP